MEVIAKWTGEYPCLCIGEWQLIVNGEDVSNKIPSNQRHKSMGTFGKYEEWHFTEEYDEVWNAYTDGLQCEDWINKNEEWLNTITDNINVKKLIYMAINEHDWRHSSCGGCI